MTLETCRLYLVAPDPLPDNFTTLLTAALQAGDVAALRLPFADADVAHAAIARVRPITVAHNVALILADHPKLATASKCDGAHLADPEAVAAARVALGDLQLGVTCGMSRDAAMRAGEEGADYVAFGPFPAAPNPEDVDLLAWWSDLMELPVVAEGAITAQNCATLAKSGADFLAVCDAVWNDPAGPGAAVRALNHAIAAA